MVSCVTSWREKRWILKQNPALGEKTEFSSQVYSVCIWPKSFVDERLSRPSQNIVLSALKTDYEFLFLHIFYHLGVSKHIST